MSITERFSTAAATLGGGFFVGLLIGYALKKVIKLATVIFGLFLAGLAYLQSQQIANINWNKLKQYLKVLLQHFQMQLHKFKVVAMAAILLRQPPPLAITSFGIPLTGSMSAGFTIGFIKG